MRLSNNFRLLWTPLVLASALLAANDDWDQLKELAPGEVRVHQRAQAPLTGTVERVTDDALVLNNKSGQTAIDRAEIVRVEWRPAGKNSLLPGLNRRRQDPSIPKDRLDLRPPQDWVGSLKIAPKTGYKTVYQISAQP